MSGIVSDAFVTKQLTAARCRENRPG